MKKTRFIAVLTMFALLLSAAACDSDITGSGVSVSVSGDVSVPGSEDSLISNISSADPVSGSTADESTQESMASDPVSSGTASVDVTPTSQTQTDFAFAENGQSKVVIVIPENPTDKVRSAAEDLQDHLSRITGAQIVIGFDNRDRTNGNFILVGPTVQTKQLGITQPKGYPGKERVIVKRINNYLVVAGNDDGTFQGTQFAVNMLLEELGCGWFGPDTLWQIVPENKDLKIKAINIDHSPQFVTRMSNVWFNYKKFSYRWYMGGENKRVGHNIPQLIPREVYFETHPEWFAEVGGIRDPYSAFYWQYCYTNKELAAEAGRKIIEIFDADPTLTQFSISANDGWNDDWCECSVCTPLGSDTDEMLTFVNNVAAVVGKKYPNKKLTILSYHSTLFPPKSGIKAASNVEVMFCRETAMTIPLDLDLNIPSGYNHISRITFTQSWQRNFKEYISKAGLKNVSIWEWYCIAADKAIWKDIPWVQGNVATRNQKLWKDNGASWIYYDQGPSPTYRENEESFKLRWPLWYVASKGMWDQSKSGEDILKEACDKLFGAASSEMFSYYKALADASEACRSPNQVTWVPPDPYEIYTSTWEAEIDKAVNAVKAKLGKLTANQRARAENQIKYWEDAKKLF
ncbi:MAG: DUF4838 domain-containing protein [Saccharofermentanales bacterium]